MPITLNGSGGVTGLTALPDSAMAAGSILQVKQSVKTDTASSTSATFADISGLSVSITPSSTSNKILVTCSVYAGGDDNSFTGFKVLRGSTAIGLGTTGTGNQSNVSFSSFSTNATSSAFGLRSTYFEFLDSPSSTSSLTYKIQFASLFNNDDVYINRSQQQSDSAVYMFPISSITVMEVAAWAN